MALRLSSLSKRRHPLTRAARSAAMLPSPVRLFRTLRIGLFGVALGCALVDGGSVALAQSRPVSAGRMHYRIPPGSLDDVLGAFGNAAGIMVAVDPGLTTGMRSKGLDGVFTVTDGLAALLAQTGLEATSAPGGAYRLRRVAGRPEQVSRLDQVDVTGKADPKLQVYETPASVATITREDMDRLPQRSIGDVLADTPGVFSVGARNSPGAAVNIRGMQDFGRVNMMIDGARQNYQQSGHGVNGAAYIDPELLAGVDIAKGPVSTSGGAGIIGGMVNFRSFDAEDLIELGKRQGGRITATTGDNAYKFAGSAAAARHLTDDVDLVVGVSRKNLGSYGFGDKGGLADDTVYNKSAIGYLSAQEYWSGLLKGTWRISPSQRLKLSYLGFDSKVALSASGGATSQIHRDTLIADYSYKPGSDWVDLTSNLYFTRTRNREHREASEVLAYSAFALQYQTSTIGGTLENRMRFRLPGADIVLKAGGEFFHDWTNPRAQAADAGLRQNTGNDSVWFTGSTPDGQRTLASLFTEASVSHSTWLEVIGGLRYDWYGIQGDGKQYVGSIANPPGVRPYSTSIYTDFGVDRHATALSPKLTVAIRPIEPVQLFASYGRGMRPPAITETMLSGAHPGNLFRYYPNPNLMEERSRSWEFGANLIFHDLVSRADSLKMKAVWFDNVVENYMAMGIIKTPAGNSSEGTFAPRAYVNLQDPFRSKGLELQADYDAGFVFGSLAYTQMISNPGRGGYDPYPLGSLVGAPATSLGQPGSASVGYLLPPRKVLALTTGVRLLDKKLTLGGRLRLRSPSRIQSSEQFLDLRAAQFSGGQVYDVWAAYQIGKSLTLRLAIDNVNNRNYTELNGGNYFVAPGRTATVSVTAKF